MCHADFLLSITNVNFYCRYRDLGIKTGSNVSVEEKRGRKLSKQRENKLRLRMEMRNNVNNKLPRNVTY